MIRNQRGQALLEALSVMTFLIPLSLMMTMTLLYLVIDRTTEDYMDTALHCLISEDYCEPEFKSQLNSLGYKLQSARAVKHGTNYSVELDGLLFDYFKVRKKRILNYDKNL